MKHFYSTIFFIAAASTSALAQTSRVADTTLHLQQVTVKAYLSEQSVLNVPASVGILTPDQLKLQPENSLVPAMNTIPGVRMEERSPGSYRLSIRGSLLRSPFGVRDVKIYFDEIPLTDAGGNTYLNAIDFNSVQGVEVLKGPDGSLFGANSGGVVLLSPVNRYQVDSNYVKLGFNGGSYGLVHENVALQNKTGNNQLNINQAYETAAGYRDHSNMYRNYFQLVDKLKYGNNNSLKFLGLYSDLNYETPGGLNAAQFAANPRASRYATPTLPSAITQQIAIISKMTTGGLVNEWHINNRLRNVAAIYGTYVNFTNPFITNYEQRYEGTYGLRTYFEYAGLQHENYNWKANVGIEWQQTHSSINDYDNNKGVRGNPQTLNKINTDQHFIFARYAADIFKRLHVEAATSLNYYHYNFQNIYPQAQAGFTPRNFTPQLMPRVALSYHINDNFIWRASVSRGYSTPTTAEILPSTNIINTDLQAQIGWNYETGFRLRDKDDRFLLDASVFYYKLQNAIVRRLNPDDTEYYLNAGGTNQPGLELALSYWLIKQNDASFIRGLQFSESFTVSKFAFTDYIVAGVNYSNNQLTGVPRTVAISSVQLRFPQSLYLFVQHNYTASIPLNDGNTVFANKYNVVQAKAGWQHALSRKNRLDVYAGVDNLFNENYSLGNDLNAVGNRYFNPAALRNFYAGFNVSF
ncbi:MAG: TonB-dependent receptor [Mucilaginibacter sp.]